MPKILIIEDDPSYQKVLKDYFEKEHFEVILVSKGQQALMEVAATLPNVIILDIMLPGGVNGFDYLEQLKAKELLKDIRVIVLTNLDSEEKTAKEMGVVDYFIKSETTIEQIVERAKQLIN